METAYKKMMDERTKNWGNPEFEKILEDERMKIKMEKMDNPEHKEKLNKILEEREGIYGDYQGGVGLRASIFNLILDRYYTVHESPMPINNQIMVLDIIFKLSRIAVSPEHMDSWIDIGGYAQKIQEAIKDVRR